MSERLDVLRDGAIGETREALVKAGRVVALRVVRASDAGRRARWGEVYAARVTKVDRQRRGAFLDLGLGAEMAFAPLGAGGKLRLADKTWLDPVEGMSVAARIAREAARGKGPVAAIMRAESGGAPRRLEQHQCDLDLAEARAADSETRAIIDAAIEEALARRVGIAGGGALSIEPTAALVAIDVDAEGRGGSGDSERFALDLNVAAAREAARQIRLRGLGGLIVIDFVSMRRAESRVALGKAVSEAFAGDVWGVQTGGFSRFGTFTLSRTQLRTPLHETLCDAEGRLSAETVALAALRAIEREGAAQGGRRIACTVAPEALGWLEGAPFDWRAALDARIGPRWTLDARAGPREKIDARAL